MNDDNRRVPTVFGPEQRFEVKPTTALAKAPDEGSKFKGLAEHLVREKVAADPGQAWTIHRAARRAGALARNTGYPLLVFPLLFEEAVDFELAHDQRRENASERLGPVGVLVHVLLALCLLSEVVTAAERVLLHKETTNASQAKMVLALAIKHSQAPPPPSSLFSEHFLGRQGR